MSSPSFQAGSTGSSASATSVTPSSEASLRARYDLDPLELPGKRRVIALSAGGRRFDDALASELAGEPALTLLCGRYEGFDERVHEHLATDVVSIGPYVLAGGELAAMVIADCVLRKLPAEWRGHAVPEILLSGDHARVREWRLERARRRAAGL